MSWVYLLGLAVVLWAACGAVMAFGRQVWSLDTALWIHLAAAPAVAFLVARVHKRLAPDFGPVLRATAITGIVVGLDVGVVVPIFEGSFAMFRSLVGTWLPLAAIFLASLAAGRTFV
jgi:hypothetical protein